MQPFLQALLDGESPQGVQELCLDWELTQDSLEAPFRQMEGLAPFVDLEVLSISKHEIEQFGDLEGLPHLRELILRNNRISNWEGLPSLPQLRVLDLSLNELERTQGMPKLPKLQELDLSHNFLTDLSGLPSFPKLEGLQLNGNRGLRDLSALSQLPTLKRLGMVGMGSEDWNFLVSLPLLEDLALSPFDLGGLPWEGMGGLRSLFVQAARLRGEVQLPPLPRLEKLTLKAGAGISALKGWGKLPNLRRLRLLQMGDDAPSRLVGHLPDVEVSWH